MGKARNSLRDTQRPNDEHKAAEFIIIILFNFNKQRIDQVFTIYYCLFELPTQNKYPKLILFCIKPIILKMFLWVPMSS